MTTQELKQYIDKVLGNNLRCLLPSYWWKRLFHHVADRIDEVEQSTSKLIESKVEEVKMPIVESVDELNGLDVEDGVIASVSEKVYGKINPYDCYYLTSANNDNVVINNWDKFKRITYIDAVQPEESIGKAATILLHAYAPWTQDACQITYWFSEFKIYVGNDSSSVQYSLEELNNLLKESDYRLVAISEGAESREVFDKYVSLHSPDNVVSDLYVKGDTWERLAKESDLEGIEGGGSPSNSSSGAEIRELYVGDSITDEHKAWNLKTKELVEQNKCTTIHRLTKQLGILPIGCVIPQSAYKDGDFNYIFSTGCNFAIVTIKVDAEGYCKLSSAVVTADSSFSDTSENAIQNKVVTKALKSKVDKVDGKQLSTEDFTSVLKAKLEGLNNYDDTSIRNAVNSLTTQINTLVSGDASVAIESFNEIIAFLNGVQDSENLDSIIAAIEQQIAGKQDKLVSGTNIKTINGESILGEGNIVVSADTSNLATKEELNAKQDKISDLETIRSGAAKGATALQEHQDISHLASKEELQNLQNEVIANEEVVAAAFNDVNERINTISENVSGTTVTKEELESTVETINQTISDNKSATDTAIEGLETSIGNVDAKFANYATTESLTTEITNLTNEIIANEEVHAAALNDLNERLAALEAAIVNR